jgi:hypothetical protein
MMQRTVQVRIRTIEVAVPSRRTARSSPVLNVTDEPAWAAQ